LAFSRSHGNEDIWKMHAGGKAEPFLISSVTDGSPSFSPDGSRVAFCSGRSGEHVTVWLAKADGSEPLPLTNGPGTQQGSPRWSPNGRWIVFDARLADGSWSVQKIDASGGQPRKLIVGPSDNICPSWSSDGSHIYFGSDRSGRSEIWRALADGTGQEKVTLNGGVIALESDDGKTLYYMKAATGTTLRGGTGGTTLRSGGIGKLYASRTDGTEEKEIADRVLARAFDVTKGGVYYLANTGPLRNEIRLFETRTGKTRTVGAFEGELGLGFAVSPDRMTFLFTTIIPPENDLMLVENFR
jgi:dipeptidyl aminopeptidase/acylaminoacyl peptidase